MFVLTRMKHLPPRRGSRPQGEAPAVPVEVTAPKAEKSVQEKVSIPFKVKFDTARSETILNWLRPAPTASGNT